MFSKSHFSKFLFIALSGLLNISTYAQSSHSDGLLTKGFRPDFIQSANRSSLAFYEQAADGKYTFVILNLKDFSQRRMEAFSIDALPTPDMKGQYWIEVLNRLNFNSGKPNFRVHYSADGTEANKKIYDGTWYPFGFMPDGNAIAVDVSLYSSTQMFYAYNLRVVDPNTGAEVKRLIKGSLDLEPNTGYFWHLNTAKQALVRLKVTGDAKVYQFNGTAPISYKTAYYVTNLADTLVLGGDYYTPQRGYGEMRAFGLMSGKKLLDTTFKYQVFAAGKTFADGRLWAIHQKTKGLTEYALTGKQLKVVKVHPLDLSSVAFFSSTAEYQSLVVSRASNRVILLPNWGKILPINEAYIWELSTGKLLHKIANFYKNATMGEAVAVYDREKAERARLKMIADDKAYYEQKAKDAAAAGPCADAKAQLKVKVGTWVREGNGRPVRLTDYDCKTNRYTGEIRFPTSKSLNVSSYPIYLFDVYSDAGGAIYKVVNVSTCNKCNGAGTISGTRNYEKVDYGIYYKYTTTGTTSFTDLCEQCKGNGVITK